MRLEDLNAALYGGFSADNDKTSYHRVEALDDAQGFDFLCPSSSCKTPHRVLVWFRNPRNELPVANDAMPGDRWSFTGSSLSDLTLLAPLVAACGGRFLVSAGEVVSL